MMRLPKFIIGGSYYGIVIFLLGLLIACPLLILPFYPEEAQFAPAFLLPSLFSIVLGLLICVIRPYQPSTAHGWQSLVQKGSGPVLFVWLYAFIMGAVPFLLTMDMGFTLSLFESVSGWTTTGLTVVDVSKLPHILLLHRSFMQYCGGLGFVILIAVISQRQAAMSLYNAEGHPDMLRPSLRGTAKIIARIYISSLFIGTAIYAVLGMPVFDALCHTMSAVSTAGFSTNKASIAAYSSSAIDIFTIVLMLIGASNFYLIMLVVRGKIREALRETEVRFMLGITLSFSFLAAIGLYLESAGRSLPNCLLNAVFGVVTTFTTTGYTLEDYSRWPAFSLGLLMLLMVIGGSAGSTAGGIKLIRAALILKITLINMRKRLKPERAVLASNYTKHRTVLPITAKLCENTFGFITVYLLVLFAGILGVTLTSNCPIGVAAFEFTSALGTVGLSCGLTNASTASATLYIEMIGMVLGRLEILMVIVGLMTTGKSVFTRISSLLEAYKKEKKYKPIPKV